jgi:hypothetical protein
MADSQDHHYVPQFLLRGWCNSSGELTTYVRRNGRVVTSERNPRGTGYEPNLYSYEQVPPERRHVIETNFMKPIDDAASQVVAKIRGGNFTKLTNNDRYDLTRFILSLRARHPDAVTLAKTEGLKEIEATLAREPDEYLAIKEDASATTLTEWTRQNLPPLIPNFGVSLIPKVIVDDKAGERVFRMPWWILDARNAKTDLLLSDRPCLLEGDAVDGECVIVLPLSPTLLLFICNKETQIHALRSMGTARPTSLVKAVNRTSVRYAAERIYATGAHHLRLAEKLLSRK